MIKKYALIFLIFMTTGYASFAQSVGDIAFLQYNSDGSGTTIKFLVLNDIPSGNQIFFTDDGWLNSGAFRGNEARDTWTSPGVFCGDIISFTEGGMNLATGGDQILAYTGTVGSPTFIAAIQMNGAWDADATSSNTSAIPTGLTNTVNCLEISPEVDNAIYSGTLTGTRAVLLAAINDQSNWTTDNATALNFTGTFTITDCPTPICSLSTTGYAGVMCNDNGTPSSNIDDFITFDLNPTGSVLGLTYSVSVSSGTITPNTGISYGSATTFTLQNGSAGAGNVIVTIEDLIGPTCTIDQLVTDPGSCNAICNITSSGFSTQLCNDNGTSTDDTDDYISFVLDPSGTTITTYSVTVSSGTITPNTGISYGSPTGFTLQNGSAGAGNVTVTIVDDNDGACTFAVPITDSGECSSTNCATELFISEYGEGSSSNKYIEIYNGTGATVDLTEFRLWKITNGGAWAEATMSLLGTLADGEVHVVANSSAGGAILAQADQTNATVLNFSGDDAIGLAKDNGSGTFILIDAIGEDGPDPGAGWSVAGLANGTLNQTLVRKTTVVSPTTNWTASAGTNAANSEWIVYPQDDWTYLGDHDDCTVVCVPVHSITSFEPSTGPVGTEVTIIGDDFTTSTLVSFNATAAIEYTYIDSDNDAVIDTIIAVVPANATTGAVTVTEALCDLDAVGDFTVIETNGTCGGGFADLMLTELYDASGGSLGYIEIYNGTGATVDLTNYTIRRYGDATALAGADYTIYNFPVGYNSIANGIAAYGRVFSGSDPGGPATPDFDYVSDCTNTTPFCGGFNADDIFHLYYFNGSTDVLIDAYTATVASTGYTSKRLTTTTGPDPTAGNAEWEPIDTTEQIDDLGDFIATPPGNTPSASAPADVIGACDNTAVFSTVGTDGSGGTLTFEWYYYDATSSTWMLVNTTNLPLITSISVVDTATMSTLTLQYGIANYNGYQFYCLVTENGVCSYASNAAQIKIDTTVWDGSNWSSPTSINKIATLNGYYDTASFGSFSACSLIVNATITIDIRSGHYVEIQNDLINKGTFNIADSGSLVQIDDNGVNSGNISMARIANVLRRDYVYWSSPVVGFPVNQVSPASQSTFIFKWEPVGINANGTEGNWVNPTPSDPMDRGVGYIIKAPNSYDDILPAPINAVFNNGLPHNGEFTVAIERGNNLTANQDDDDWNLIGNPYPSAINAVAFLTLPENSNIHGYVDIWTHGTDPSNTTANPFYEDFVQNYSESDYLRWDDTGTPMGPNPNGFSGNIASGQGFMVNMVDGGASASSTITFNNSLRVLTDNGAFYKTSGGKTQSNTTEKHRIWLGLIAPSSAINRILVGYIEGATMEKDRMYDAVNYSNGQNFYSILENEPLNIQGRALPFDEGDIIPLGINTVEAGTHIITINALDGLFESDDQDIYLKDNLLDILHDLRSAPYSFTTDVGEFNSRFELVFSNRLSVEENTIGTSDLSIIELDNGDVRFSIGNNLTINSVEIIDILGRTLYRLKGNNSTEVYNLSNLSQATYIAKVELSNGQIIAKKAIKRK